MYKILASQTLPQQEIELMNKMYVVYLKEVPTKLGKGGIVEATTVRAFVRESKRI